MKVDNNALSNAKALETQKTTAKAPAKVKGGIEASDLAGTGAAARGGSNVEISDDARLMQKATELATGTPDIRKEKVAALKKAIADGSYKVDAGLIADKLVDEHINSNLGQNEI